MVLAGGVPLALLVSFGALGGRALDRHLDTTPWITVAGSLLGLVAGLWNLVRMVNHFQRQASCDESPSPPQGRR